MTAHEPITTQPMADAPSPVMRVGGGVLTVLGGVSGLGAIAASSCCVIPLTLSSLGAGAGVFGTIAALAPWRLPLLVASTVGIAAGWFTWWRKHRTACGPEAACAAQPRSQASFVLLLLASLIALTAIGWNYLEPSLLKLVQSA
ncbi:mercuric transporter MerT family protein [Phyllobacterium sp. LjRoot231]|uniref:mercuric transporter MerT family protein n=1 Tax=Phyllobacterium sp. LjRoot231 TaxID=3342289 RepID=UPI003ECC8B1A